MAARLEDSGAGPATSPQRAGLSAVGSTGSDRIGDMGEQQPGGRHHLSRAAALRVEHISHRLAGVPAQVKTAAQNSTLAGKMASNMLTSAWGNALTPAAALLSMPILTYSLGVEGRGEIAAATAPLLLATTAATFGIPEAVTYLVARSPRLFQAAIRRGTVAIIAAGIVATIVCYLAAGLLSGHDHPIRRLIIVASLALVPTMLVLIMRAAASGLHRWRLVAFEQGAAAVLRLIGIAGLAAAGHLTPFTATVVIAVTPVLGGLVYVYLPRQHRAALALAEYSAAGVAMRQVLSYGSRIWIGSLSGVLLSRLDQVVMTPLSSAYQLGLYAVAVNISDVALILHSAVRDVTFAADASAQDDERLCASARISGLASLCFGLLLAAMVPVGLPLLFGYDFSPAIPSTFVLLAAVVLVTPGSIAGAGLSARGRPGLRSMSLVIACLVNIVALVLLVPHYGAMGAAWATFIGNVVTSQLNIVSLHRVSGIPTANFYGVRRSDLAIIGNKLSGVRRAIIKPGRSTMTVGADVDGR